MIKISNYIIAILILFSGCRKSSVDKGVYFQNFDDIKMWIRDPQNITDEKARSGKYSTKADANNEYSQTFEMDFAYAQSKGYKKMKVSAWCFLTTTNAKAGLVASVEAPEKTLRYNAAAFEEYLNAPKEWGKIMTEVNLPDSAPANSKIKVYCWSPNKQKVFMDDVEIQFN